MYGTGEKFLKVIALIDQSLVSEINFYVFIHLGVLVLFVKFYPTNPILTIKSI